MKKVRSRVISRVFAVEGAPGSAVLGGLVGAALVGIPWGLLELRSLMVEGVALTEGLASVAAVVWLVAFACTFAGAVVGWVWRDRRLGGRFRGHLQESG